MEISGGRGRAVLFIGIQPRTIDDAERLTQGLERLTAEDPTIVVQVHQQTGEVSVGGRGELHLEIIIERLKREFSVEANVGTPQVAYMEVPTQAADGETKYLRQVAGRAQYAHVKLRFIPARPGTGYVFVNGITGGAIPAEFIPSVDDGIRAALTHGMLAGHPIDGVRVHLLDGSYRDTVSTKEAFRIAGSMAAMDAARKAAAVLYEPVMLMEVNVPEEQIDGVAANLAVRRGQVLSRDDRDGTCVILARVPLAELFGYATALRERTTGRGSVSMRFERYQPRHVAGEDDYSRDSLVGAPLEPKLSPRAPGVALPEPDDEQDDDLDGRGVTGRA
jgi:elongation factor G